MLCNISQKPMRLIIHRGTHEIGGNCVELCSASDRTRIVLDLGMPLVTPEGSSFDFRQYGNEPPERLIELGILPDVEGLYAHQHRSVSDVVLSHAHQDHYGFLRFLHPDIPLHMSVGTRALVEVSNIFLNTRVNLEHVQTFEMWRPFQAGDFTITPYLVDHSAPDAAAFLIQADGKRVFYTGDFRGHGRKGMLLNQLVDNPVPNVDCLIMEGSMIGRDEPLYADETAVEQAISQRLAGQRSYTFVFGSSQNLDRIVSVYRAVRRNRKLLVMDLYTALVLHKLRPISDRIPQFDWDGIGVLWPYAHYSKIKEYDSGLLRIFGKSKITWNDIRSTPQDVVILVKDNRYFRGTMLRKLEPTAGALAIYSMWHGYLEGTDLPEILKSRDIELVEIHTSGHAYVQELMRLASALEPQSVVPIHTFSPEEFSGLFPHVIRLHDGEPLAV